MLTEAELDSLVALTFLISPDELDGKVIFCVSYRNLPKLSEIGLSE